MKMCKCDVGHMSLTKMSATSIYGKNLQIYLSSPEPVDGLPRILIYSIWELGPS